MSVNFYESILRQKDDGLKGLALLLMKVKESVEAIS